MNETFENANAAGLNGEAADNHAGRVEAGPAETGRAGEAYYVQIEGEEGNILRQAGEWIVAAAEIFFGGNGVDARHAAVVIRERAGEKAVAVLKPGSFEEAEVLEDEIEAALKAQSVGEFEQEWVARNAV